MNGGGGVSGEGGGESNTRCSVLRSTLKRRRGMERMARVTAEIALTLRTLSPPPPKFCSRLDRLRRCVRWKGEGGENICNKFVSNRLRARRGERKRETLRGEEESETSLEPSSFSPSGKRRERNALKCRWLAGCLAGRRAKEEKGKK